ncbi:MAG: hypothetical protein ORN21_05900 [Methylophilaceae bacterium]|nr:hypothetical protein [Methylophilaceae bacterium]
MNKDKKTNLILLRRLGWMLFDDINKRLNILIEECTHLQQLVHYYGGFKLDHLKVFSLISKSETISLYKGKIDKDKDNEIEKIEKLVEELVKSIKNEEADNLDKRIESLKLAIIKFEENRIEYPPQEKNYQEYFKKLHGDKFFQYSTIERSMMALYEHLGGLILALKSHKELMVKRFESFLCLNTDYEESWFWFVALRAHFLHDVLGKHMEQLEHAHEKLIQILETKPGALPQPILLRRWNSALQGRFLSEYSRHIEWETNELINKLRKDKDGKEKLREARHETSFIHSWAHTPTSMVKDSRVESKYCKNGYYKLGSVRSAFFYLENPLLYPLLYHECTHLQYNWDTELDKDNSIFFSSREKVAETIKLAVRASNFDIANENEVDNLTQEIWADTISVTLGGIPYLTSLVLQIFGHTTAVFFDSDNSVPMQNFAKDVIYDIETPNFKKDYFWSTRIRIVMDALQHIYPDTIKDSPLEDEWIKAVNDGIQDYNKGGQKVFSDTLASKSHADTWKYRKEINDWLYKVISNNLRECSLEIKKEVFRDKPSTVTYAPISEKYVVSKDLIEKVINPVIKAHCEKFFIKEGVNDNKEYQQDICIENKKIGIENALHKIRWLLSKCVVDGCTDKKKIKQFTRGYSDYVRSDGSAAFRIVLEWIIARNELSIAFSDILEGNMEVDDCKSTMDNLLTFFNETEKEKFNEIVKNYKELLHNEVKKTLITYLRYHKHYNVDDETPCWCMSQLLEDIYELISKVLYKITEQMHHIHKEGAKIGMATLGVLSMRDCREERQNGNDSPYLKAAIKAYDYYENISKGINDKIKNLEFHDGFIKKYNYPLLSDKDNKISDKKTRLYFLTGDYDFIHYQADITPAELSFHPYDSPPLLTKSRSVLDLYLPDDNKPYHEWGQVSLLKFRYRWEIYALNQEMIIKDPSNRERYTLSLSSAWEDGILITWHQSAKDMLDKTTSSNDDLQSNLVLFKLEDDYIAENGVKNSPVPKCFSSEEWNKLPDNNEKVYKVDVDDALPKDKKHERRWLNLTDNTRNSPMTSKSVIWGREDFCVTWKAKSTKDMAEVVLKLPYEFWENVHNTRTSFTYTYYYDNDNDKSEYKFTTYITEHIFRKNKN